MKTKKTRRDFSLDGQEKRDISKITEKTTKTTSKKHLTKVNVTVSIIVTVFLAVGFLLLTIWPDTFEPYLSFLYPNPTPSVNSKADRDNLSLPDGTSDKSNTASNAGQNQSQNQDQTQSQAKNRPKSLPLNITPSKDSLLVHFIDVGQGDCILIQQGEYSMLIDAGGNSQGGKVVEYISSAGIETLNYVIGTHPHEDHIGGLDNVIYAFNVKKVVLPDIITTTKVFEDVLKSISNKGLRITKGKHGQNFKLGEASVELVAPVTIDSRDLNNASIVCRVAYKNTSFLFTGDAETKSEREIIEAGYNIKSDLLKAGHHGSDTSSSAEFLKEVSPKYAVIMCGDNNTHGHPNKSILDRFTKSKTKVFRTDLSGTIIVRSDGSDLAFNVEPMTGSPGSR